MKTETYTLPAFLAPFLVNGDSSGLSESEIKLGEVILHEIGSYPLLCSEKEFFTRYHDCTRHFPYAAMCLDYIFPVKES